jgi:anaerobic selenocysteine-containing dehydrogenase
MSRRPTSEEMLELIYRDGVVPFAEVKAHRGGAMFDREVVVGPRSPECTARLQLGAPTMMEELAEVFAEYTPDRQGEPFPFRLVSRRLIHVYNSAHREMPELARGRRYNPLFMHPDDMAALGLAENAQVRITSPHSAIDGIVAADDTLRPGVASMTHAFGVDPDKAADVREVGSNIGRLTPNDVDYDRITGIPRMSAIPVRIAAA